MKRPKLLRQEYKCPFLASQVGEFYVNSGHPSYPDNTPNMRLKSVETFKEGNRQYFVGIFEAGTQGYYLFHLEGWKNFSKKWEELGKKNYRLIDIETYIHNGKRMYIGVWEPGKGGYYLWQVKGYQNFAKKFLELNGKMELIDLEVIY